MIAENVAPGIETTKTIEKNRLGMLLFLLNEATFFAILIFAYIYFHSSSSAAARANLDIPFTSVFTIFLFASSFTVWMADRSLGAGNRRGLIIWLGVTILFGATFLVGQGLEYYRLLTSDVTISRDLFGTTFFTLTGFHGFHVLVGLIMLSILLGLSIAGYFKGTHSPAVDAISIYWHFVDAVWVVIYSLVYLWTLFS